MGQKPTLNGKKHLKRYFILSLASDRASDGENSHENDIGRWVGRSFELTSEKRMEMLKRCWVPSETYDFAGDATHLKRKPLLVRNVQTMACLLKEIERCVLFVSCFVSAESCTWRTGICNCSTIYQV